MNFCDENDVAAKICVVLHDIVDDMDVTLDDLRAEAFSEEIITTLDCLTKRDSESYDDFIGRILTNRSRSKSFCWRCCRNNESSDWEVFNTPRYIPNMTCYRMVLNWNTTKAK